MFANKEDLSQMLQNAASDLGLHCLPITLLGVSRLKLVNYIKWLYKQHNIDKRIKE